MDDKGYDALAWFYERYWSGAYHAQAFAALDRIVLSALPPGAPVLDLCCGTGILTRMLADRGFAVTGLDLSAPMLEFARARAPGCAFACADARSFRVPAPVAAVLATFESMNHLLGPDDLGAAFRSVAASLVPGGIFAFDLITGEAFETLWGRTAAFVAEDNACILGGGYDPAERIGRAEITMFRRRERSADPEALWVRNDVTILERCHRLAEVEAHLRHAGFSGVGAFDAPALGMSGDLAIGRIFVRAVRGN